MLHHVGVASSFDAGAAHAARSTSSSRTATRALDGHPWREWAEADAEAAASRASACPGGQSRWNAGKDLSWEPLRIELVAEVAYEHLQGDRFRHTARFQRWRPDRDPASCTYEQLDAPVPDRAPGDLRCLTAIPDADGPSVGKLGRASSATCSRTTRRSRDAPVAQLVARLNEEDRLARAIAKYPNHTDAEIHGHLAEFHDRIGAVDVEQARRQALGAATTDG